MIDERLQGSFWLSEFIRSDTAVRLGLDNTPAPAELERIRHVLAPGMQRVRNALQTPVLITSGFRGQAVNTAIRGSKSSQHMQGVAADFISPAFGTPKAVARYLMQRAPDIRYDQLIWEGGWVHVSFTSTLPRSQVLTAHFSGAGVTYTPGLV